MGYTYLFDKVVELKEKFRSFFVHKKKLQALENYSAVAPFEHKGYLGLIKRCMNDGFLGEKESDFLGYMLERYEINFLDWAHRTKWLKGEMNRMATEYEAQKDQQLELFSYPERSVAVPAMPIGVLSANGAKQQLCRRV